MFTGLLAPACRAAQSEPEVPADAVLQARQAEAAADSASNSHPFLDDARAFVAAPLHWDRSDWLFFGGAIVATAAAHHYDDQVRTHFTTGQYASNLTTQKSNELKDAAPALAAVAATWLYGSLVGDYRGHREAAQMVESAVLSVSTVFVLRLGIGRERPADTADSNRWFSGSNSFPSLHSTGAFAIGTVLAESGNDDYRALRRLLGYGLGAITSYERLKHNDHWLSDTVAGAAMGIASARFVMNRRNPNRLGEGNIMVTPVERGVMLTYSITR